MEPDSRGMGDQATQKRLPTTPQGAALNETVKAGLDRAGALAKDAADKTRDTLAGYRDGGVEQIAEDIVEYVRSQPMTASAHRYRSRRLCRHAAGAGPQSRRQVTPGSSLNSERNPCSPVHAVTRARAARDRGSPLPLLPVSATRAGRPRHHRAGDDQGDAPVRGMRGPVRVCAKGDRLSVARACSSWPHAGRSLGLMIGPRTSRQREGIRPRLSAGC